jgi:hypothetical protein
MKTIKTWLPIFPGFYNTFYELGEEPELEYIKEQRELIHLAPLPYEAIKWDYDTYHNEVAKNACNYIESVLENFVTAIKFEEIRSPKEYNFSNDAINIEVELSEENIIAIKTFLFDNIGNFRKYISETYTSYDGFLSYYNNGANDWLDYIDLNLEHEHKLGAILQFICYELENDIANVMPEFILMDVCLQASNYDECTMFNYCPNCKEFFNPATAKGNICNDCLEKSILDYGIIVCSCCGKKITNKWAKRQFQHKLKHGFIKPTEIFCDLHELILA